MLLHLRTRKFITFAVKFYYICRREILLHLRALLHLRLFITFLLHLRTKNIFLLHLRALLHLRL